EKNVGILIDSLLSQDDFHRLIHEIIVVSSGSTDKTNRIIQKYVSKNKKIRLLRQSKRNGKASAVNLFIEHAKRDILILVGADLLLEKNTIKKLLAPLRRHHVGITGAHPIPVNNPKTFMGFIAHLQWQLHHEISLKKPKMGEMIAFRKIFKQIPSSSSVDEANIEPLIRGQGFKAVYCTNSIIHNKGPERVTEFIARRRHVYFGHIVTKHEYGYEVSTLKSTTALISFFKIFKPSWRYVVYAPAAIFLEAIARVLGFLDYKLKLKTHTVWEVTPSSKNLAPSS
ncbi:MAG: glycosyltransferase, partial [Candidatus Levybacteria bacterium]|nr:glycosyltransferase [Candidatus Levybacteria bacterium]